MQLNSAKIFIMLADDYIQHFKTRGFRVTRTRRSMIEIFLSKNQPLSPQDVATLLSNKGVIVNKTTIYRELDFLMSEKIIREVKIVGKSLYYELSDRAHHHHVICNGCGIIEDISLPEKNLFKEVVRQTQFEIKDHSLEFYGHCRQCK